MQLLQGKKSNTSSSVTTCEAGGNTPLRTWGISSIFGSRAKSGEAQASQSVGETASFVDQIPSTIQLSEVIMWFTDASM